MVCAGALDDLDLGDSVYSEGSHDISAAASAAAAVTSGPPPQGEDMNAVCVCMCVSVCVCECLCVCVVCQALLKLMADMKNPEFVRTMEESMRGIGTDGSGTASAVITALFMLLLCSLCAIKDSRCHEPEMQAA